jgi:hypothetical protein
MFISKLKITTTGPSINRRKIATSDNALVNEMIYALLNDLPIANGMQRQSKYDRWSAAKICPFEYNDKVSKKTVDCHLQTTVNVQEILTRLFCSRVLT